MPAVTSLALRFALAVLADPSAAQAERVLVPVDPPPAVAAGEDGDAANPPAGGSAPEHTLARAEEPLVFTLVAVRDGPLTIAATSLEFDAALSVSCGGEVVASDASSGPSVNPWLMFDARGGETYAVEVASEDRRAGALAIAAWHGRLAPPAGDAMEEASAAFEERYAAAAREQAEIALEIRTLLSAAHRRYRLGDFARAEPTLVLAAERAAAAGDAPREATASALLGAIARRRFDLAAAEEKLRAALAVVERDPYAMAGLAPLVFDELGCTLLEAHRPDEALPLFERLLAAAQQAGAPGTEAATWARIGRAHDAALRFDAAAAAFDEALRVAETLGDAEAARLGSVLLEASRFHGDRGAIDRAEASCARAVALLPRLPWDDAARVLLERARIHQWKGEYVDGLARLDQADALLAGRDAGVLAPMLANARALFFWEFGELHEARELLEERERRIGAHRGTEFHVELLCHLAQVCTDLGDTAAARAAIARAEEFVARENGAAQTVAWLHAFQGARVEVSAGEYSAAEAYVDAADGIAATRHDLLMSLAVEGMRAWNDCLRGDSVEARRAAQHAMRTLDELGHVHGALATRHTLAAIELREGRLDDVRTHLEHAMRELDRGASRAHDALDAAGIRSNHARWSEIVPDWTAHRLQQVTAGERVFALAEGFAMTGAWKGRALLEGITSAPAPFDAPPEALLRSLAATTGDSCVLVEYAAGATELYAWVLRGETLRFVPIGNARELETLTAEYVDSIVRPEKRAGADRLARAGRELFDRLMAPALAAADVMWSESERQDGESPAIVIVPSAGLSRLPFEALVLASRNRTDSRPPEFADLTYLADLFDVSYAPSSPVLAALSADGRAGDRSGGALLVGDPVLACEGEADAGGPSPFAEFRRLPATRDEVLTVARALVQHQPEGTRGSLFTALAALEFGRNGRVDEAPFTVLLGADANAANVREAVAGRALLHVATHGFVHVGDPRRAGLLLSAGADDAHGFLSLARIVELQLDADLAVLSACDSATGPMLRGEGVQSLATAFLRAGARGVVASLWPVGDAETAATMKAFYRAYLVDGEPAPRALNLAKRELRGSSNVRGKAAETSTGAPAELEAAHPFVWAPFIYSGRVE